MISIEVKGEQLDLYANTSIELEFLSPAFHAAGEDGSFGYPFTLPGTPRNHRLTGHAYDLQKREVLQVSLPAKISILGLALMDGILKLTFPVGRESLRVFIVMDSFADVVKDQKLRSVDFGPIYSIPIFEVDDFMNDRVVPGSDDFAFYPSQGFLLQNKYENGSFDASYREVVPHPYLQFIYRQIFTHFGYRFQDRFFTTADLRQLTLYHHRHVTFNPEDNTFTLDLQKTVPDIDVSVFLKNIASLFNLKLFPDNRRKTIGLRPLQSLLDGAVVEWTRKADSNYNVEPFDPEGFKLIFSWSDIDNFHEVVYEEGFKLLMTGNSVYIWDNRQTVGSYEELLDLDPSWPSSNQYRTVWVEEPHTFYYADNGVWKRYNYFFADYDGDDPFGLASPQVNGVYYDPATRQYWMYLVYEFLNPSPVWRRFSYRKMEELEIGEGNAKITANAHSVELFYHDQRVPLPTSQIPLTGNGADGINQVPVEDDGSIRLLIYRGLDETVYPGPRYPFATPDEYDTRGALTGTHSLRWEGPRGLYEKCWKRWLGFLGSTRKVKRQLRLTAADIFNLDFTRKVRIGNINYLIGKINIAVTMNGLGLARCELYSVGSGAGTAVSTVSGFTPGSGVGVMSVGSTNTVG
ncbi:MAG: hypothetical protein AAFX78_14675 [Cyanobacteria bacterium J06638_20]